MRSSPGGSRRGVTRRWPSFSFNYQKWRIMLPPPPAAVMHSGPDLQLTMIWFSKTNSGFAFWSGISISFILYSIFCQVFFLSLLLCVASLQIMIPWLAVFSSVMKEMKESHSFQFSREDTLGLPHYRCQLITVITMGTRSFPPKTSGVASRRVSHARMYYLL